MCKKDSQVHTYNENLRSTFLKMLKCNFGMFSIWLVLGSCGLHVQVYCRVLWTPQYFALWQSFKTVPLGACVPEV